MAGMKKKIIEGLGKAGKDFTKPNTVENGGGLSALLVPRKLNAKGGLALMGAATGGILISEGARGNSRARAGTISYGDSMARMTNSFNTGVVDAMQRSSGGDYEEFSEMAKDVLQSPSALTQLDDFGANPGMISALYNMGGK